MADSSNGNGGERRTEDILDPEQIESQRERLTEERERIMALYEKDFKAGQAASDEGTEDLVDQANKAWNREFLFALSDNERKQLVLVEAALERLEEGTYGYCLYSGQPIAWPRLQAVPWARYTVDVQEKIEKGILDEEDLADV